MFSVKQFLLKRKSLKSSLSHSCHSLQSYLIPTHPFSSSHSKHFNPSNLIHFQVTYHSLCLESSALNHCMAYFQSVRPLLKLTSSERLALTLIPYPRPFTPSSKKNNTTSCPPHFCCYEGWKYIVWMISFSFKGKIQLFIPPALVFFIHINIALCLKIQGLHF